jgi:nicotinamidase-related amidase
MSQRVWDRFLTEEDKAHLARSQHQPIGFGEKPALLLIDIYRGVFGDQPEPLLDAIKTWPGSMGLGGWEALKQVQRVLAVAREVGIPVIHATGNNDVPHWSDRRERMRPPSDDPAAADRRRRRFDIMPEVAPLPGEVVIRKSSPSAFFGSALPMHLNYIDVDTVIVCGESTSGCVRASVVDGCANRYRMVVVEEGVWDRHQACHAINLFDMNQKYADVLAIDEVIAWMRGWRSRQESAAQAPELAAVGR